MKHRMRKLQIAISLSVMLTLIIVGLAAAAVPTIPDHFDDADPIGALSVNYSVPSGVSSKIISGGLFGTERDIYGTIQVGSSGDLVVRANDGGMSQLTVSTPVGMGFTVELQWDGTADSPKNVVDSALGLGGQDLTQGLLAHDRFVLMVNDSDHAGVARVSVFSSATSCSIGTVNIATAIYLNSKQRLYELPYASMTQCADAGITSGADFAHVTAVVLTLTTNGVNTSYGWDVSLEFIATAGNTVSNSYQDFGDLPVTYERYQGQLGASNLSEAVHVDSGLYLGTGMSVETIKTGETEAADADSLDNGVVRSTTAWTAGAFGGTIQVFTTGCSTDCYLMGFIDWNQDGDFWDTVSGLDFDANEALFATPQLIPTNPETFSFAVPAGFENKSYHARFRIMEKDNNNIITPWGAMASGEVEDYLWTFGGSTAVEMAKFDAASPASPFLPLAALALPVGIGLLWMQQRRRK